MASSALEPADSLRDTPHHMLLVDAECPHRTVGATNVWSRSYIHAEAPVEPVYASGTDGRMLAALDRALR